LVNSVTLQHLLDQGWTDAADILNEIERSSQDSLLACWTLPWSPTANTYWRHIVIKGQARSLISKRGRQYAEDVARVLQKQRAKPLPSGMPLYVKLICYPPDRRTRDLSNLTKALEDSIVKAGMLRDDSDIWHLELVRACLSSPPGRIVVEVRQHILSDEQPRPIDLLGGTEPYAPAGVEFVEAMQQALDAEPKRKPLLGEDFDPPPQPRQEALPESRLDRPMIEAPE
jgi:crossover junction endodeoxyribonuclease RusA